MPALIHRFHNAKVNGLDTVDIWGDGTPLREFLYVDDLARACLTLLRDYDEADAINIGSGQEISIKNLAIMISEVIGFSGQITFNKERPNGTPRKLLDSSHISNLGWSAQVNLEDGISSTYNWFLENHEKGSSL